MGWSTRRSTVPHASTPRRASPQVIEFRGRLENLPIPVVDPEDKEFLSNLMVIGVWNDVLVDRPEATSPALIIKSIEFEGSGDRGLALRQPPPRVLRRRARSAARGVRPADPRALPRPGLPAAAHAGRARSLLRLLAAAGGRRRELRGGRARHAGGGAQLAQLSAPRRGGGETPAAGRPPLEDHALASRLSYLLWNSMPDDELLALAGRGELRANLPRQAARLLDDPRARDFFDSLRRPVAGPRGARPGAGGRQAATPATPASSRRTCGSRPAASSSTCSGRTDPSASSSTPATRCSTGTWPPSTASPA